MSQTDKRTAKAVDLLGEVGFSQVELIDLVSYKDAEVAEQLKVLGKAIEGVRLVFEKKGWM